MPEEWEDASPTTSYHSGGLRLLAILIAAIVIGERAIGILLRQFDVHISPMADVVGAVILTALLFPILYYAVFKDVIQKNKLLTTTEGRLRAAHNWLEQCINERTEQIQTTNQQLEAAVRQLKHQQQEMLVLSEMSRLLQACSTVAEACRIVEEHLHRLFPAMSLALYLKHPTRKSLEKVTARGKGAALAEQFAPEGCWALRHSRPHQVDGRHPATACNHRDYDDSDWHLCLPMMAQGETLGLICLQARHGDVDEISEEGRVPEERLHFYVMIADSLALAIANLRLRETLRHQAIRDPMTGLYNRRYFDETLERELDRAAESGQPLSLVLMDVDRFKRLNDTYGHGVGDGLLADIGAILGRQFRDGDVACRFGGDEFALILPGASRDVAAHRLDALREEIKGIASTHQAYAFGAITVSAGIAEYPGQAADKAALVNAADKALYESKPGKVASLEECDGTTRSASPDAEGGAREAGAHQDANGHGDPYRPERSERDPEVQSLYEDPILDQTGTQ
jgi:diguanylate cyclase (GGDEF)-like protein